MGTHSNTSTNKEIEEYSEEKDDETEKENSESEESNETEKESEENEDVREQTDEDDKVKCKVDYDMNGHEDITVKCRYLKKSHKNVQIPDTYCKEILKHVKQYHPWLGWTIEDAKHLLEQEIKEMEENEIDWLDFVDPKEYEDNVTAVKMKWINLRSKMGLSSDKYVEIKLDSNTNANEIKTHVNKNRKKSNRSK